jgi:alkanesulfonate monooxygenase SsuD/methylene tetrahydromethanopterin reductase-like flavin-dependent oxidoreductase (luciferase family)
MLGIGVGWDKEEFADVDESFENRGRRSDEIIHILRRLWTERNIEHHGDYYSFGPVAFEPKPVQKPGPPIIVGGNSPAALRRAALLADGWYPAPSPVTQRHELTEIAQQLAHIHEMRREAGRGAEPFDVTSSMPAGDTPREVIDNLRRLEDAGITRMTCAPWPVTPPLTEREITEGLERFAGEILHKL